MSKILKTTHYYDDKFFDWVDSGAVRSAREMLPIVMRQMEVESVVDVGCGRGAWLSIWKSLGVADFVGLDGSYVDTKHLHVLAEQFVAVDLVGRWQLNRKFDLAQCLEVGEHLPIDAAPGLVRSLCQLADVVLFSAAVPGQGGEMHINEQEPTWWAKLFASQGYRMFDSIRSHTRANRFIEPWYRHNVFLYANETGMKRMTVDAIAHMIPDGQSPADFSDVSWKLRRLILRRLPVTIVTRLSKLRYHAQTALRSKKVVA
jgi:hypothetical protein